MDSTTRNSERIKKPNVGKEVEKYLQSNSQITKYWATRNLLKTGVKFRFTEDEVFVTIRKSKINK
jgi:hypothetical protein